MAKKETKRKKPEASAKSELGRKKTWAFRILALILIPTLLFGGLEAGLRLLGFGYPTNAFSEHTFNGKRMCFPNNRFSWRFFPRQMARDFDTGLSFEKEKTPGTFRIFVLGGSAARGTPDQMFSFGRMLEAMLSDRYPDIDFEVYNAAMTAINSHVVIEIARDCAEYDPDLFIVYLGNNEVVGPFGPGTVFTSNPPSLPMIRANIAFKSTRTGQLLDQLMKRASSDGASSQEWAGLAMFMDKDVRPESRALERVYHHFEKNLQHIIRIARHSDTPVILSNVGANLRDCPPFASLHRNDLSASGKSEWETIYQEGVELEEKGQFGPAIERYLVAAEIDDTYADLQFRLGRCYRETGDYEKAKPHYQLALQNDTLRARADSQINNIIRKTAEGRSDEGVYFADSVAAFQKASPHQLPGSEVFYEHVHLKHKGNYTLARTLFPIIQQMLPPTADPEVNLLSEEEVAQRIAYTDFDKYRDYQTMYRDYLNKPPFTHQLYHDESMRTMQAGLERMRSNLDLDQCQKQYGQAIRETPDDWRLLVKQYQLKYKAKGEKDLKAQVLALKQILALHPYDRGYYLLGNLFILQGRLDEAEKALNTSLSLNPVWEPADKSLEILSRKRTELAGVLRRLERKIKAAPDASTAIYHQLATLYDNAGKTDQAILTLRKAIKIFPENDQAAILHCHIAELLNKQGRREEALEHMEAALRISPEVSGLEQFKVQYSLIKEAESK